MKLFFAICSLTVSSAAAPVWTPPFVPGFRKLHPERSSLEHPAQLTNEEAESPALTAVSVEDVELTENVAEERCRNCRRLQICFAQDVTPSFAPLLGNLRGNYTRLINDLEAIYPGSEFALGEFRDHAIKARPFRLQTSMTDAASFLSMIDDVYGGRPPMSDSTPRDSGAAAYDDDLAGEAALDGAYFCWRDGGFSQGHDADVLKMVVIITDALPRLPFWDLSRDQEQLYTVARKTFGSDFRWTPWDPLQTYQETRWADWISPEQLGSQIQRNPVELYALVANDFEGHNPRAGWMDAFRRMGVPSSHYLELSHGLANIHRPLLRAIERVICPRAFTVVGNSEDTAQEVAIEGRQAIEVSEEANVAPIETAPVETIDSAPIEIAPMEESVQATLEEEGATAPQTLVIVENVLTDDAAESSLEIVEPASPIEDLALERSLAEKPFPPPEAPPTLVSESAEEHHEHDHVKPVEGTTSTTTTPCPPTTTTTTPCPPTTTTTAKPTTTTTTPCPPTTTTTKKPTTTTAHATTTSTKVVALPPHHPTPSHSHVPTHHHHHAPPVHSWHPADECRCSCECRSSEGLIEASIVE